MSGGGGVETREMLSRPWSNEEVEDDSRSNASDDSLAVGVVTLQ